MMLHDMIDDVNDMIIYFYVGMRDLCVCDLVSDLCLHSFAMVLFGTEVSFTYPPRGGGIPCPIHERLAKSRYNTGGKSAPKHSGRFFSSSYFKLSVQ